ncbi:BCCT family transporter, partial [Bacillus cereus group sp. BC326]
MFIARVSKGRTVREFITAVLLIPTAVTVIWMSVFGGLAIEQVIGGVGELGQKGLTDVSLAMFQMFDVLPLGTLLSIIAVV